MAFSYKSAISFGLVYFPVTLHACIKSDDISFNTLYKKTGERIKYKKTCEHCPPNINKEDIVKGFQYDKDKYVILTDSEIEKLKTPKEKSIDIESFVFLNEIDPIYFDKSYFVKPTGAENAFLIILKALKKQNKVGIAKTVLGSKEQVVAIREINGQMILNTMHFYDEVVASPVKDIKDKITEKELSLAEMVIENMTGVFEPEKYRNEYKKKIMKAIDDKIAGKKIKTASGDVVKPYNVVNLMEALEKSLKQTNKGKSKSKAKPKQAKIIPIGKRA